MPSVIDQLTLLAQRGLCIHPLQSHNKIPIIQQWQNNASTNLSIIKDWSSKYPDCNWGIVTGKKSKIFVVDIDAKNGGIESWAALLADHQIPDTPVVITGGGGLHYYFVYPSRKTIRNSASKIGKGIDIRGDGGQVVIPPSIHPSGKAYEWEKNKSILEIPIAVAPKWLLTLITSKASGSKKAAIGEKMVEGTRNNQIYYKALQLAKENTAIEFTIHTMMIWCKTTDEPDMTKEEITATVESAYKYWDIIENKTNPLDDFEPSDVGNARRMLYQFPDQAIYVPSIGWHVWDKRRWRIDLEQIIMKDLAVETMSHLKISMLDKLKKTGDRTEAAALFRILQWAISSHNMSRINAMIEVSKYSTSNAIVKHSRILDGPKTEYLLNFVNGTLDLITNELLPHNKDHLLTRLIPHNYDSEAKCPTWLETLNLAFNGDADLIAYFQRAIGYSLSGVLNEQCFFICWGPDGNNGKSTMMETIQSVLGEDYALMTDARVISSPDRSNHVLSSLAQLHKIRMMCVNEIAEGAVFDEELIKQLTGGDTLQAKQLYMAPFTFKPTFKIWIRANNKPTVRGTGDAFWRRVKLIPFIHPIPVEKCKPRSEIDALLLSEAEGILAWAVRGFQDWYKNGLQDPQTVVAASKEYRTDSDVINQFFDECVEEGQSSISRQILYSTFVQWSRDQGFRYVITANKFTRRVRVKRGLPASRPDTEVKERGVRVWRGIRLTENASLNYNIG